MNRATFDRSVATDVLYEIINAPVAMLRGIVLNASHNARNRRDEKQLQSLDDHMLRDIGVTRGEIRERVWGTKR